jgi:hypothetical protein
VNLWTVGCADPRLTAQARSSMDKPGETARRFPHLAHRSAAAHKLHSAPAIAAEVCSGQYTPRSPIGYLAEKSKGYAGNW